MAMSEEAFDAAMATASNVYGGSMGGNGFSSKVEEKRASLFDKTDEKKANILGQTTPVMVQSVPDGDGYVTSGGTERRMVGYDAYEVKHKKGEHSKDLSIQKQKISQETGVPYDQITDDDVYKLGNRDKLNNLYEMVREPGDAPWSPGPTTADPLTLGSRENPLDIAIRERQEGRGTHGRILASAFNPNTQENVNEQMYSDSNALYFKDKKNKNGKFIPDTNRMETQNAATYLNNKLLAGKTPTPEEIIAFNKSNDMSRGSAADRRIEAMYNRPPGADADGRVVSLGKGIVAGGFNIITNILDTSLEAAAWAGEKAGVISEEQKKIVGELADSDLDAWNKFMNVNTQYVDAANKELADSVQKGNYIDAAWSVLKNLDVHLAQSAPEMGALALKVPGLIAAVNSRVGEVSEEFTKDRGREPTSAEEAGMWASAAAVLVPEKFLMIGPIKAIFKSSRAAAKSASKSKGFMNKMNKSFDDLEKFIPQGKTLGGSAKAIGMTAGGEVIQEVADQAQETAWKEGRMLTADEAITASIAGGVMSGALKGAGEAKNVAKTGKETLRKHQLNKNVSNMSKEDIALRKEDAKEMMAENDRNIEGSQKAHNEVGEAKTFEDLVNSDNKDISNKAKEERLAIAKDKDFYKRNDIQKEMKENLSLLNEARRKRVTNDLKLEETASDTEILEASTKAGENISPLLLQANVKKGIIDAEMNSNLDATKKSMQEGFIQAGVQNKHNKKQTQSQIDELSQVRQTQGKKGNVSGRRSGTIDVSEKALNEQTATGSTLKKMSTAGFEILKNITGQGSTVNRRVNTELDKYDNESIRKAIKTAGKDSNIERLGQKILDKRRSADEYKKEGIQGDETYFERDSKKKGANFQKLKRLVSQGSLSNQQEKDYIHKAIDEIEKRGDINKKQATIMRNRLNKNKVGSKADTNDLANKKLFRDSNDVQADMDKVDDQIIDLDAKDKGSGANQKKIETLANIRASLARDLAQELKYEKDNNITPEPAQVVPEPEAEPEVEAESKEEAKEEAEPKEEAKEPTKSTRKLTPTGQNYIINKVINKGQKTWYLTKGAKHPVKKAREYTGLELDIDKVTGQEIYDALSSTPANKKYMEAIDKTLDNNDTLVEEDIIAENYTESEKDLEPKNKNAAGTNFTEAELNGADPVSDGYEEGGNMTEAELKKLIEC